MFFSNLTTPIYEVPALSIKIPFARRASDDRIVSIDDVPRGKDCGCVCPLCSAPLMARKGEERIHHFAHMPGQPSCGEGALESSLHQMAKQVVLDRRCLWLPVFEVSASIPDRSGRPHGAKEVVVEAGLVKFDQVLAEVLETDLRADLIGRVGSRRLWIEFAFTHASGKDKREKLRERGLAALEVDIGMFDAGTSRDELEGYLLEGRLPARFGTSRRKTHWICHPDEEPARTRCKDKASRLAERANEELKFRQQTARRGRLASERSRLLREVQVISLGSSKGGGMPKARWFRCEHCTKVFSLDPKHAEGSGIIKCPRCQQSVSRISCS